MKKQQLIEEKIKAEIRNGGVLRMCDACNREIELWEKVYDFGGKICHDCYLEVGKMLK